MKKLLEFLRTDEELNKLREEWYAKFEDDFPLFNTDEYNGIDDYKNKIREKIENK